MRGSTTKWSYRMALGYSRNPWHYSHIVRFHVQDQILYAAQVHKSLLMVMLRYIAIWSGIHDPVQTLRQCTQRKCRWACLRSNPLSSANYNLSNLYIKDYLIRTRLAPRLFYLAESMLLRVQGRNNPSYRNVLPIWRLAPCAGIAKVFE